jgi:hypothetical protein
VRKYTIKRSGEALVLEVENVFKIAVTCSRVREFLTSKGWEFQGKDEEMEMDLFRNKKTGKKVFVEDISEDFPVTFLMGELSVLEFSIIASELTPEIHLLKVDSSWEGKPTTIVVAMTEEQVRNMFGRRTKMRKLAVHRALCLQTKKERGKLSFCWVSVFSVFLARRTVLLRLWQLRL